MTDRLPTQPTRRRYPLIRLAHERVADALAPGAWAVDATAGNGHDTLFLARCVGSEGRVFTVDIAAAALNATGVRLDEAGVRDRVVLLQADHADLGRHLPHDARGRIAAVMFNLGFLPGGDKSRPTRAATTCAALDQALDCLRPGGLLSVLCYTGHPEGAEETRAVEAWVDAHDPGRIACAWHGPGTTRGNAPRLLLGTRRGEAVGDPGRS